MASILELHGAGLERMMEITSGAGDPVKALIRRFAGDNLVASLLVLHNLHPDDLETRVQHASGKLHGSAELIGEFRGSCPRPARRRGLRFEGSRGSGVMGSGAGCVEIVIEESFQPRGFVPLVGAGDWHPGGGLTGVAALRQFVRPRESAERCDSCGVSLSAIHSQFDPSSRRMRCACERCARLCRQWPQIPRTRAGSPNFK